MLRKSKAAPTLTLEKVNHRTDSIGQKDELVAPGNVTLRTATTTATATTRPQGIDIPISSPVSTTTNNDSRHGDVHLDKWYNLITDSRLDWSALIRPPHLPTGRLRLRLRACPLPPCVVPLLATFEAINAVYALLERKHVAATRRTLGAGAAGLLPPLDDVAQHDNPDHPTTTATITQETSACLPATNKDSDIRTNPPPTPTATPTCSSANDLRGVTVTGREATRREGWDRVLPLGTLQTMAHLAPAIMTVRAAPPVWLPDRVRDHGPDPNTDLRNSASGAGSEWVELFDPLARETRATGRGKDPGTEVIDDIVNPESRDAAVSSRAKIRGGVAKRRALAFRDAVLTAVA